MTYSESNKNYSLEVNNKGWGLCCGKTEVLTVVNVNNCITGAIVGDKIFDFNLVSHSYQNNIYEFKYECSGWEMIDSIEELDNGFFCVKREWKNTSIEVKNVVLIFEAITCFEPDFYMIPCVSYNGNQWGNEGEPKGLSYNDRSWVFAYDRTGLPSATFSEDNRFSVGVFASDEDEKSLVSSSSLVYEGKKLKHRILWPDREEPVVYISRDLVGDPVENSISLSSGEIFAVKFYISVSKVIKKNFGWTRAYDLAIDVFRKNVKPLFNADYIWKSRISYIKEISLSHEGEYSLFHMGLLPGGQHIKVMPEMKFEKRSIYEQYEIGWCGQNASQANALIHDYILNNDKDSLDKGIAVLDTWAEHAIIGNGLFYTYFDDFLKKKDDIQLDTCNLGWGAWQIMEGYLKVKNLGIERASWLEMGLALCDFFIENKAPDGTFGKLWSIDGKCTEEGGTVGCYTLLPMIKAFEITGNEKYLRCAEEVYKIYADRDLAAMQCTAGALDTCCVDKETCWPLLKAGIDLFEITGKEYYLEEAKNAGYYLLSWMYHYNVLYNKESDFEKHGYYTYGGTSVSVQHHHLDPWGGLICYDWLRLYKHTGDIRWKARFQAAWTHSLLCVSDGNLVVHGILRPTASQNEAYFQCNWCFEDSNSDRRGRMNDWLQSWPGAFKLINLMREKDWNLFDI